MLLDAVNFCSSSLVLELFFIQHLWHGGVMQWCTLVRGCYLLIYQDHLMRYGVFYEDVGDQQYSIWHSWAQLVNHVIPSQFCFVL
jgi:hypothetical protein